MAAGPAIPTEVPGTRCAAWRTSSRTAGSSSPRSGASGTTACTASPSSETTAGEGGAAIPGRPASSPIAPVAASCCPMVTRAPFEVHTTMAGTDCAPSNALRASRTFVDSALRGRNAAWSFVATSRSFPAYGPSVPPMPSHTSSSASGTIQRAQRGAFLNESPLAMRCEW